MDNKLKHLEFIQGVVNRLARNSFLLKGWSVVLVSALFTLSATNTRLYFIYLAYFPAIAFWILDGYFLWQERLFRALYDHVRALDENEVDFSMDTRPFLSHVSSWSETCISVTLRIFHGVVLATIIIVMLISILSWREFGG